MMEVAPEEGREALPPSPPAGVPAPSFLSVLRAVLFLALAAGVSLLAGRRWAEAYSRYRSFHAPDATPSLIAAESPPPAAPPEESAAKQPRAVVFRLDAPAARTVLLGGSFNGFDAREAPMARGEGGTWETTLVLPPGKYFYKFKVDGRWTLDPANPERRSGKREASILNIQ